MVAIAVFTIDYWHKMLEPPAQEFVPREFASPAVDPGTGRRAAAARSDVSEEKARSAG